MGEGIAVDRLAVEALGLGEFVESSGIVPTRRARLFLTTGLLEKNAQGVGTVAEGCGNPRRQAIAAGGTYHQHPLGSLGLVEGTRASRLDLLKYILFTANGMGGGADE